jgi:zinc transporter ZupT
MSTTQSPQSSGRVAPGQQLLAIGLLLGVALLAYGYFSSNRTLLAVGLAVTLAGVLLGVVQIITKRAR